MIENVEIDLRADGVVLMLDNRLLPPVMMIPVLLPVDEVPLLEVVAPPDVDVFSTGRLW